MKSFIIKYSIPLILIPTVWSSYFPGKIVAVTLICLTPLFVLALFQKYHTQNIDGKKILNFFLLYNALMFIRGVINADTPTDWISLFSGTIFFFFLFPFYIYKIINPANIAKMLRSYILFGTIAAIIIAYNETIAVKIMPYALTIRMISGLYLLILFVPYIKIKWKAITIIVLSIMSFFLNIEERFNLLNIMVAFAILFLYYFKSYNRFKMLKFCSVLLFAAPIVFFVLGVTGIFNVFKTGEKNNTYIVVHSPKEENLLADSRTGIYMDVLYGLRDKNAFFWGLGATGKVQTSLIDFDIYYDLWRNGRPSSESGMLNYVQWGGFLGGLSYFMFFMVAAYYAIRKSNNWFIRTLGLWISYKAMFSFIQDYQDTQIFYFLLILNIGICLNKDFRKMNDTEMKSYLNQILTFKI
ncbi:MAG: hypothetical protein LBG80_10950 [Bacteroidales bacterium]|jgi:hypothetical protein|nr:hypothetical protein [Bacteroidales bacterium]